jgi:ADP-ribosylglycohydrolase
LQGTDPEIGLFSLLKQMEGGSRMKRDAEHFRGCLLGGALGDALGWPVEFLSQRDIAAQFGPAGILSLQPGQWGYAEITDDTQMTLFTGAGILDAAAFGVPPSEDDVVTAVYRAYLWWLHTQGFPIPDLAEDTVSMKLAGETWLQKQRGPGHTCVSALASGRRGSPDCVLNDSKGCGGVMRAAPLGLMYDHKTAFRLGVGTAALTHGHPSGYYSAGLLAAIVSGLIRGADLAEAVAQARVLAAQHTDADECLQALDLAVALAAQKKDPALALPAIGEGWVGEESLAIAVYCSMRWPYDFCTAVTTAVNHDGDSDSTGAITGNICGAYLGVAALPQAWLKILEGAERITAIADDLLMLSTGSSASDFHLRQ